MPTQKISITARIEEVPALAQFLKDSYNRDIADFQSYKPAKYVAGWLTAYNLKVTAVTAIINPKQLLAELKVITLALATDIPKLQPLMNRLEGYLRDATGLTIGKKDFGISEVRKAVNNDDQEKLDGALAYLLQNITNNNAALTTAGFPAGDKTAITNLKLSIFNNNAAQNAKMSAKALLVTNNIGVINELCNIMKDAWADGKSIYKTSDKTKLKDYTNAQLINRIRQEELKTKISGVVKGPSGPEANAKVSAKPVDGGRGKTVKTNANGEYELKGLKPGSYTITVTSATGGVGVTQADAVTGTGVTAGAVVIA